MNRALRVSATAGLAVTLFAMGGVGWLGDGRRSAPPIVRSDAGSVLLGPGGAGDLDRTIAGLQSRLRADPSDWQAFASLGLAYLQKVRLTGDPAWYPKAEGALDRSIEMNDSENFHGALGMGALSLGRHDFDGALSWGRTASAINPYGAEARGVIGDALIELGRYRAAARAFQRMVDLRPSLSSYARVAYYRELTGDVTGATQVMAQAVDLAGVPEDAAWAGYQLGELQFGQGRLAAAAAAYRMAAMSDPASVLPRMGLAKVAAARGYLDRATGILEEAVGRYPAPEVAILLGDVQTAAGDRDGARDTYALVRAMDRLYRAGGVDTDLEMALFHADHGLGLDRALNDVRSAFRSRPSVQAADALAWVLSATGRHQTAERLSEEALRLGTRSALFQFHAGMVALRLGDESAARDHLGAALELNPHFSFLHAPTARRVLERLVR